MGDLYQPPPAERQVPILDAVETICATIGIVVFVVSVWCLAGEFPMGLKTPISDLQFQIVGLKAAP